MCRSGGVGATGKMKNSAGPKLTIPPRLVTAQSEIFGAAGLLLSPALSSLPGSCARI